MNSRATFKYKVLCTSYQFSITSSARINSQDLRNLANSSKNPISIIISSQHLYEVEEIADNIIFIKGGQAAYNGSVGDIGKDEDESYYEISCSLSKEELKNLIDKINYKNIEKAGNKFIIYTCKTITNTDLLKVFVEHNISLKYFRDISKSTRKFFDRQS